MDDLISPNKLHDLRRVFPRPHYRPQSVLFDASTRMITEAIRHGFLAAFRFHTG